MPAMKRMVLAAAPRVWSRANLIAVLVMLSFFLTATECESAGSPLSFSPVRLVTVPSAFVKIPVPAPELASSADLSLLAMESLLV